MFTKLITNIALNKDDDIAACQLLIRMLECIAQESEQKRKACMHFTQINLF